MKTASGPTVYYVNQRGIIKPIPSVEVFFSYGYSFANVETAGQAQLDGFPLFQAIMLTGGDGRVYIVDSQNRIQHWVKDLMVFEQLNLGMGQGVEVNQTEFEYYAEGEEAAASDVSRIALKSN